jgi:glycosyltransferase involved in cell wall biosynthesis
MTVQRYVLIGDGDSAHLLKWARALAAEGTAVFDGFELWAASSRGFLPGFDTLVPASRRLALETRPAFGGGNAALLLQLPKLARWLNQVQPTWLHAHYLSSHGTLAWLAQRLFGVCGRIIGSAWGSDILHTPERSFMQRALIRRVLAACTLTTSDSRHMAERMTAYGAREVMTFPFGLEAMPAVAGDKDDRLFFANRGLERLYAPERVLTVFAGIHSQWCDAQLVVANDGAMLALMEGSARELGLAKSVRFVGRLDAAAQAQWYDRARWYLSLPTSDSVSVSVLEAMAHGCIPILSDLPANRELVESDRNGVVLADNAMVDVARLERLVCLARDIAADNRAWVARHALFAPAVRTFLERLKQLAP